jgi:hypothetical protein
MALAPKCSRKSRDVFYPPYLVLVPPTVDLHSRCVLSSYAQRTDRSKQRSVARMRISEDTY